MLFAGDNTTARGYATPRQRGEPAAPAQDALFEPDLPWTSSTAETLPLRDGLRAEGARYLAPPPSGQTLEAFRGVESELFRHLAEGQSGACLRAAPRVSDRWSASRRQGEVFSLGRDGTVLVVRAGDRRR
ncbi:hypothetical protein ACIBEF_31890 [Micromonospora sp. NPDC050795]|uniref:hypothetical protein n=1 Tax=Micromonospora sp. NPDC050795 TaxID=3364282 RepID=UPI0037B094B5